MLRQLYVVVSDAQAKPHLHLHTLLATVSVHAPCPHVFSLGSTNPGGAERLGRHSLTHSLTCLQDEAPRLWKDMSHPASPRRPYWDILPSNGSVFSYYNMPLQYLALVQHAATVSWL
jgi:hypothetical protein